MSDRTPPGRKLEQADLGLIDAEIRRAVAALREAAAKAGVDPATLLLDLTDEGGSLVVSLPIAESRNESDRES